MQTKKKYLILVLIILLISGCKGGGKKYPVTSVDIYKGTDGITAKFFNVPDEVFEGSEERESSFRVNVELENKGAYPEKKEGFVGYLALGIEEDYMEVKTDGWIEKKPITKILDNKKANFQLKGKTIENPLGDKGIVSVDVNAKKIRENQSERHDTDVLMTVCYKYQTKAVPTVCIDTTQYAFKEKEKSCVVKDIILNSQGAPIAVTKIETEMLPEKAKEVKPMFLIYIENKGNGEVVNIKKEKQGLIGDTDYVLRKACSAEPLEHDEFNSVYVKARLGEDELECSPNNGLIRLKNKEGIVRCILEKGISQDKGTYTTPLQIIIDYGYTFTISKQVTVKRILTY